METPASAARARLTRVEWLICVMAALGFAFDTYELLMLPLVLPGAIRDLGGVQLGTPEFARWRDLMFFAPAIAGGIFGLLGGYLTHRLGRRRVLVWTLLLFRFSPFPPGFAPPL